MIWQRRGNRDRCTVYPSLSSPGIRAEGCWATCCQPVVCAERLCWLHCWQAFCSTWPDILCHAKASAGSSSSWPRLFTLYSKAWESWWGPDTRHTNFFVSLFIYDLWLSLPPQHKRKARVLRSKSDVFLLKGPATVLSYISLFDCHRKHTLIDNTWVCSWKMVTLNITK